VATLYDNYHDVVNDFKLKLTTTKYTIVMKTTNLRNKYESNTIPSYVCEHSLGTIAVHDTTGEPIESQVVMSEKNFRLLLDLIPKTNSRPAILNEIQRIKDLLTQATFESSYNRSMLIDVLQTALNYNIFMDDVEKLNSQPMIVGKIDLNECV
jgi:hypothetical protein